MKKAAARGDTKMANRWRDKVRKAASDMNKVQDKINALRKKESVNEKISKEEWAEYPKYARKLKPYMQKLLKVPLKVRVIKQAFPNPWIDIRVARFGKDIIPNDFRKKALKVIGGGKARDMDNINYGNIRSNSVSLKHDQWVKLLGNKVKESVNELSVNKDELNELSMAPFSSPEAKQQVDRDVTTMSKHLGKTSQQIIKIMMDGVKSGQYDAMDLQRGIQTGSIARTHFGELDFIQQLWRKVRSGFRRYSKRGKLR